jgi:cobalt-zinc-cadmium efflux system outer membrane protein
MRAVVLCAICAALAAPRASAQSLSLTESEALARLSPDSPRVRAIRGAIEVARADVLSADRWPNPRFTFDRESVAGQTETMAMVGQVLPITGRRGLEVEAASAMVGAAEQRADDALRRARADLRLVFAQLAAAQARERELTTARDRLNEVAGVLAKREAAGDAAGFDRLRAEREVVDLDADRASAAVDRARAQAALSSFFGDPVDPSRIVAVERPSSATATAVPPLDALIETAESKRGDLRALRKELEAAQLSARAADRRNVPEPEIVAGAKSSNAGGGDVGTVVTVIAPIPIFDRSRPERALALARERQAQARVEALRLTLRSDLSALRTAVVDRRAVASRYRTAVSSAGEIERIAQVSYDAGERGILELLDAFRVGSSARTRQASLELAAREAEIELEFASGWEIP